VVVGRDEARKHLDDTGVEHEVVPAALELDAAHLDDPQRAALGAELARLLLEGDDAVRDAVQLEIRRLRGLVVEEQDGAVAVGEEVLQREDLPTIAQRILGQQAHLGQAVEDDPTRAQAFDLLRHRPDRLPELDLRRMKNRLCGLGHETDVVAQFLDLDAIEAPSVGPDNGAKLAGGLGQRDVQPGLARGGTFHQELQTERGLARAWRAFQKIHPRGGQTSATDGVQAADAGRHALGLHFLARRHPASSRLCPGRWADGAVASPDAVERLRVP
jgi:hypothetical protein